MEQFSRTRSVSTYAASFETRYNVGANNDYASFGLGAMHDEAGAARYTQNKVQVGGASQTTLRRPQFQ
ncbi:MAG: hypothetical protein IPL27_28340 [Lewinellaceae bacterium]|nr:hypothetical protein [Lewinellaceae bacterium]